MDKSKALIVHADFGLGVQVFETHAIDIEPVQENTGDDAVEAMLFGYRTLWGTRILQRRVEPDQFSQEEQDALNRMKEAVKEQFDQARSKRDKEYNEWQEYLRKLACSIYNIDPSELGSATDQSKQTGQQYWDGLNRHRTAGKRPTFVVFDEGVYPDQSSKPKDGIEDLEWDEAEQIYKQKS